MASRLSRRKISEFYAKSLISGIDSKDLAQKLAAFLIDNKRTKELQLIVDDIKYYLSQNGFVLGEVASAFELDARTKTLVKQYISEKTNNSEVELSETIDKSLLGGIKLRFGGFQIDRTIAKRLTELKTKYKE